MSDYTEEADLITNEQTEETTVEQSQETLESDSQYEDDGLTPQARAYKEKRREENRQAREALKELPSIKAKLEFTEFLRKTPQAEDYEKEITDFRAKNPTIWLEQSFRYVLADLNPAKLAEMTDPATTAQREQARTAPLWNERSFSEQTSDNVNPNDMDSLRKAAEKNWSKLYG